MVKKTKLRPRRLFYDDKNKRYFYLINKKKKFINIGQIVSQKQISKINIQNIIPIKTRRKRIRKASEVKPITNQQIVTRLIPIAPISANLSESRLFKGQEIEDKKKVEEDKKKIEELKKKSEEEKKSLTDSIKKLDEEKQKLAKEIKDGKKKIEKGTFISETGLKELYRIMKDKEDRLDEIKRERDIIEDSRKQSISDIDSIRLQTAELTRRESELKKQEDETRKIKQQTLLERMEQLNQRATPILSESESSTPTRIPKPSKPPSLSVSPVSETDRIINFMSPEIDLTPEPVNIEEANEGDIGYETAEETKDEEDDGEGESKEDTTVMETKEEKPIKKVALSGIKKKLKDIIITEYAGRYNYPEFINWWENSKYGNSKTPSEKQFDTASMKFLYEILGYSSQAEMDNADAEEVRKRREAIYAEAPYVMSSTATNTGRGNYANDNDGIYNDELQKIFSDKTNKFLPVIASDKMDTLLKLVDNDTKKFAWIQNTEPQKSGGRHWVAYFIDIPNLEINYFDSLVENGGEPTKQSLKGLKKIIDKINPEYYLKLKTNSVMLQNIKSSNCGYFALKFIMDRYRNIPFRTATMYDKITGYDSDEDVIEGDGEGEQMISKFKRYL